MTFSLLMDGMVPLLAEDGLTVLLAEDGVTWLTVDGTSDISSSLLYGSLTQKRNTFDFTLVNAPTPTLGAAVTTTDPAWVGSVAAVTSHDPVDLRNWQQYVTVTATNTAALPNNPASAFDLSDVPVAATLGDYLLEDGSGHYLLESGTDFATPTSALMLEQPLSYAYSNLSVRYVNGTPPTTLGQCTVQQPGLRAGDTVHITSFNQGLAAVAYQINQATIAWIGVNPPKPIYLIEFGDTPQTLAAWTLAHATPPVLPVTPPVVIPSGPVIYGACTATAHTWPAGGGIVTIASATFTVSVPTGHTLTVQLQGQIDVGPLAWDNTVATPRRAVRGTISGGIYTGAWQETPFGVNGQFSHAVYDLSSGLGIALAAGTYTVTIDIDTAATNQLKVLSGWAQAYVTTV